LEKKEWTADKAKCEEEIFGSMTRGNSSEEKVGEKTKHRMMMQKDKSSEGK